LAIACSLLAAASATAANPEDAADPKKVDTDYAFQGEYAGELETEPWGVQIIALGQGKFDTVGFSGACPAPAGTATAPPSSAGPAKSKTACSR
jgi:hypothetical protein